METQQNYAQYFEIITRKTTGQTFWACTDNAPEELRELIHSIHEDLWCSLPNDWIYETIYRAFEDLQEQAMEEIKIQSDDYNSDLLKWLENNFANEFCAMVMEGFRFVDIWQVVSAAQYDAKYQIYLTVDRFINDRE